MTEVTVTLTEEEEHILETVRQTYKDETGIDATVGEVIKAFIAYYFISNAVVIDEKDWPEEWPDDKPVYVPKEMLGMYRKRGDTKTDD